MRRPRTGAGGSSGSTCRSRWGRPGRSSRRGGRSGRARGGPGRGRCSRRRPASNSIGAAVPVRAATARRACRRPSAARSIRRRSGRRPPRRAGSCEWTFASLRIGSEMPREHRVEGEQVFDRHRLDGELELEQAEVEEDRLLQHEVRARPAGRSRRSSSDEHLQHRVGHGVDHGDPDALLVQALGLEEEPPALVALAW